MDSQIIRKIARQMVRQKGNWRIQIDKKSYKIDRLMIRWTYGKMDRTIKKYINQIDRNRKKIIA